MKNSKSILRDLSRLTPTEQRKFRDWSNERLGQQIAHRRRCMMIRIAADLDEQEENEENNYESGTS